jgi:hypothetical protein
MIMGGRRGDMATMALAAGEQGRHGAGSVLSHTYANSTRCVVCVHLSHADELVALLMTTCLLSS